MDKWSENKIFEGYDDSDSTYLFIKLSEITNDLKMNKIRFANYPQVLNKIKKLIPGELIRYRTTLQTYAGDWKPDEWFSDIESISYDGSAQITEATAKLSRFVVGAVVCDNNYGKGVINQVYKAGLLTVLIIKFDDYENTIRKMVNLEEMRVIDVTK